MGVKFVTPKSGDSVAVVARSVEAKVVEEAAERGRGAVEAAAESPDVVDGATIDGQDAVEATCRQPLERPSPDENTEE